MALHCKLHFWKDGCCNQKSSTDAVCVRIENIGPKHQSTPCPVLCAPLFSMKGSIVAERFLNNENKFCRSRITGPIAYIVSVTFVLRGAWWMELLWMQFTSASTPVFSPKHQSSLNILCSVPGTFHSKSVGCSRLISQERQQLMQFKNSWPNRLHHKFYICINDYHMVTSPYWWVLHPRQL